MEVKNCSKITTEPPKNNTVEKNLTGKEIITFYNECHAVRLITRGNDDHICFEILTEDDEHWYVGQVIASSYWINELIETLQVAAKWLEINAEPELYDNQLFGYKLKKES